MSDAGKQAVFTLPSGAVVDLDRPDFLLLKTSEDFIELRCALMEKIIDIELQIDLWECAATKIGENDRTWLARAKAALKWGKLYRDECQSRAGLFNDKARAAARQRREARFVEAARDMLPAKQFYQIGECAGLFDDREVAA